jgi:hypothetical protein
MIRRTAVGLGLCIIIQSTSFAQPSGESATPAKPPERDKLFGMKRYYEPASVQRKDGSISFALYRNGIPGEPDSVGNYTINCATRDFVLVTSDGAATQPDRVLAGEELYPIGKKYCEWEAKGTMQKFFGN